MMRRALAISTVSMFACGSPLPPPAQVPLSNVVHPPRVPIGDPRGQIVQVGDTTLAIVGPSLVALDASYGEIGRLDDVVGVATNGKQIFTADTHGFIIEITPALERVRQVDEVGGRPLWLAADASQIAWSYETDEGMHVARRTSEGREDLALPQLHNGDRPLQWMLDGELIFYGDELQSSDGEAGAADFSYHKTTKHMIGVGTYGLIKIGEHRYAFGGMMSAGVRHGAIVDVDEHGKEDTTAWRGEDGVEPDKAITEIRRTETGLLVVAWDTVYAADPTFTTWKRIAKLPVTDRPPRTNGDGNLPGEIAMLVTPNATLFTTAKGLLILEGTQFRWAALVSKPAE